MKLYYPDNLDLREFLPPKKHKHIEKYHYVISHLYSAKVFNSRYEKNDYIHLNNKFLRNILTTRWANPIKKDLIEWGIIEENSAYQTARYSKSYRLTKKYRDTPIVSCDVSKWLEIKIKKYSFQLFEEDFESLPITKRLEIYLEQVKTRKDEIRHQYDRLKEYLNNITIEFDEAMLYINKIKDEIGQDKYNTYFIAIEYIYDRIFYFKTDTRTGRVYTNITNLFKELRQFLRYKGESLYQVDIANSQPFFFNFELEKMYPHKGYGGKYDDVYEYMKMTKRGYLYNFLAEAYNKEYGTKIDRDTFKKTAFGKIFFCRKRMNFKYTESVLFKKQFPNVFKAIIKCKKDHHSHLALKLQTSEADIMIDKIAIPLSETMPIFTIHDSIMTTKKHIEEVKKFIKKAFKDNLGLIPTFKHS